MNLELKGQFRTRTEYCEEILEKRLHIIRLFNDIVSTAEVI
jgi:hypothetical protein